MKLIGLAGLARTGKDTVGNFLVSHRNLKAYAFADPLKQACSATFGVPVNEFYDDNLKDEMHSFWGITRREMMQKLGTECVRHVFGYDTWIRRAKLGWDLLNENPVNRTSGLYNTDEKYIEMGEVYDGMVITDCRFDNEAEFVKNEGGVIIEITRDIDKVGISGHESEAGVSPNYIDFNIYNASTLKYLYGQVDEVMKKL